MRPIVKICGLMRAEDVRTCIRYGVDILGFVVDYPRPVPWNLSAGDAGELISNVVKPAEACIVTGGQQEKIYRLAAEIKPSYVQLHSNETVDETLYLVKELGKHGIKVIKSVFPNTPFESVLEFSKSGVYALLLDPRSPDNANSGGTADPAAFEKLRQAVKCPVILAGGITHNNVSEVIRISNPWMIDLMTGVEQSPGVKDPEKISALMANCAGCSLRF